MKSSSPSQFRKKRKKLDAICEEEYNRNHVETKEVGGGDDRSELRRSSRVRRAPVILDASPPPPTKRRRVGKNVNLSVGRSRKSGLRNVKEEDEKGEEDEDLDPPEGWKARLRSRGWKGKGGFRGRDNGGVRGRRKLFGEMDKKNEKNGGLGGGKSRKLRTGRVEPTSGLGDREKELDIGGTDDESMSDREVAREKEIEARAEGTENEIEGRTVGEENETEEQMEGMESENESDEQMEGMGSESESESESEERAEEKESESESESESASECESEESIEENESGSESEDRVEEKENECEATVESMEKEGGEDLMVFESAKGGGNDCLAADASLTKAVQEAKSDISNRDQLQEGCFSNYNREMVELSDKQMELSDCLKEQDVVPIEGNFDINVEEDGGINDGRDRSLEKLKEVPLESESTMKVDDSTCTLKDRHSKPSFKQGRRCGLCGGGTDGKPPKKLVQDIGDSDTEAHSGSSASEEPNYDTLDGFGDDSGWLGCLLGPINDRYGIAGIWVHQHCAVWSPEVYFAGLGCLKNVRAALCRGRTLKCTRCGRPGATIGCRVDRCPKTYHLPCARANSCIFDHRKFLIACTDHRHLFQPYGSKYRVRMKKMKAKKMKLEMRKLSNDAWRKDVEAEEKWLENCGEDEEFLKRESKRLHRDLLRVAPVYIGGSEKENGKPLEGWESVAGLQDVIRCMKEVVILPLLYPEFFANIGLTPPRGVLLHGYPGTGKTLVVRALIGSLARGDKRIAYFARKGADCLGKYVGDAERQLRLLFQVAEKCQPSIIFFDEIDGLAPRRTRQQDQTHSSVVSTLLALLDGLKSRGSVVVIGATNRPDAIDPALRRPGRFDREIYFPLPSLEDRAAIVSLHTKKWPKPVSGSLLNWIARKTVGFAGADLQALCTQAAIIALKRNFPLQEVMSSAQLKNPGAKRVALPGFSVEERDWLEALSSSPPPCSRREAGIAANEIVSSPLPVHLVPCLLRPLCTLLVSFHLDGRISLPPLLSRAAAIVESVIVSALSNKRVSNDRWWSHVDVFLQEADIAKEMVRKLSYAGILSGEYFMAHSDASADSSGDFGSEIEPSIVCNAGAHSSLSRNVSFESRSKSGFCVLISGSPRSGQRHLVSCVLHSFVGDFEIQKIDMATISQEGSGDMVQGVTSILINCASKGSCAVFMPRIDLWALETQTSLSEDGSHKEGFSLTHEITKDNDVSAVLHCETEGTTEPQSAVQVSRAWSAFVEQVESIFVSKEMMILATSGVPYEALPERIRQFFRCGLSTCSQPTSSRAVPRFSVQVGESFDHDMAITLSVAELSKQAIQPYIHLIHQRTHTVENFCKEYKQYCSAQGYTDNLHPSTSHGSGNDTEHKSKHPEGNDAEDKSQLPDDSSLKIPPLLISRNLKTKSSLLLSVSTFGYQILRYPHFAELCWVTSKLKEGPCSDVSGPWRGWPFNSCIIRPSNSLEQAVVASGSCNVTSKESFGIVRGLIAVGLSAYRGIYTSPREVAFEVRKVLELLVGHINSKVNAGKDRYQYLRLLSQVAYLEDMVNSWAYAMRSMEPNARTELTNDKPSAADFSNTHPCVDELPLVNKKPEPSISGESCPDAKVVEENPKEGAANVDQPHLKTTDGDFISNSEDRVAGPQAASEQEIVLCRHRTNPDDCADGQPVVDMRNGQSDINCPPHTLESTGTVADSKEGSSKQSLLPDLNCSADVHAEKGTYLGPCELETTGTVASDGKADSENGPCSLAESGGFKFSESEESCYPINCVPSVYDKPDPVKQFEDMNISSRASSRAGGSDDVCLYRCCSRCVNIIQDSMHKLIIRRWGLNRSDATVEDVHDAVASLSVELLSVVRKLDIARNNSNIQEDNLVHGNRGMLSQDTALSTCPCKNSEDNFVMPVECSCHSPETSVNEANISTSSPFWLDPIFVFRDGILVPVNSVGDLSFHCKFESLCLCSLIESIATRMQRFN